MCHETQPAKGRLSLASSQSSKGIDNACVGVDDKIDVRCARASRIWKLTRLVPIAETRQARIWRAEGPQAPCVLKIYKGPNFGSEHHSVHFLRQLDPHIAAQVKGEDPNLRAILMEWLPGPTLKEAARVQDPEPAVDTVITLAREIQRTSIDSASKFKPVTRRLANLDKVRSASGCKSELARDIVRAQKLSASLQEAPQGLRAIHGDLRFENIIVTPDGPRLIDPKAQLGEIGFEVADAICFALVDSVCRKTIEARVERCAEPLETTPKRLLEWAAVKLSLYMGFRSRGVISSDRHAPLLSCLLDLAKA